MTPYDLTENPITATEQWNKDWLPVDLGHGSERTVYAAPTPIGTDADGRMLPHDPEFSLVPKRVAPKHVILPNCGHEFVSGVRIKQVNCDMCWFAFFQVHGEFTQSCDELVREHGLGALAELEGKKLAINFARFMATVNSWKKLEGSNDV